MQFTFAALCTLAVATLTAATPTRRADAPQCNVGTLQCCQDVQAAGSQAASNILGPLGIVINDIKGMVGITCNPVTIIGTSGNSCNAQPVCCTNNTFNGLISIGCSPVNINL